MKWFLVAVPLLLAAGPLTPPARAKSALRSNRVFPGRRQGCCGDLDGYSKTCRRTPRLDRMAAQGLQFTRAYAGSTVCAPTCCAHTTGRHMGHARVRGNAWLNNPLTQALCEADMTMAYGSSKKPATPRRGSGSGVWTT